MMPPPVNIDPHQKTYVDMLADAEAQERSRRSWIIWLAIFCVSMACIYAFNHDYITGRLGSVLALASVIGVGLFVIFLSTKAFGRSSSSFRWWWMR